MNELANVKFDCADAIESKIEARISGGQKLRSVYKSVFGSAIYAVRLGMGGRQWELGRTTDRQAAVRFADMAILFFWKYRKRRLMLAPSDADLNLGIQQAKTDLETNLIARAILENFEAALLKTGVIFDVSRPPGDFDYAEERKNLLHSMGQLRASIEACRNHFRESAFDLHASVLFSELEIMERRVREFDRAILENVKSTLCK